MYTDRVFLFVLTQYNKILGELINREGFFCGGGDCCWVAVTQHSSASPVLLRGSSGAVTDAMQW